MTYAGTGRFLVSSFSSLYSLTTDGAMTFVASLSGASRNQGLALIGNATDHFSFTLTAGDRVTLALEALTSGNVDLALLDSDGGVLATGSTAQTNVDEMVYNFTVPYTGTYLARVTGANVVSYSLLATRNAVFDREGNNTPTSAQPMGGNAIALGHVGLSGTLILNATNSGWWNHSGFHSASNTNYLAGLEFGVTYRDFFVFDLASVTLPIAAAEIRIYNPVFASPDPTETYALFDVSTPLSALQATGSGQTGIFADLGTGVSFGTRAFSVADNGQTVSIALNAAAVASLNAGIGGAIALGGAVTTLAGSSTQYVFAFSSSGTRQLVLTLADPGDYYSFSATAGQPIHLVTATPGDGPGEFVNTLNPRLELFDPDGAPIGTVVILGDGRNEQIDLVAPAPGTYIVRVSAQGGTSGEYILDPPVAVVGALLEPTPRSQAQLGNEAATPELAAIVAPASAQSPPNSITTLVDRSSAPSPALSQLPSPIQLSGNTVWTPMSGLWVDGVAEYDELLNQVARARLEGPAASLQGEAAGPPRRDAVVAALPDGVVESGAGESSPPAVPLEEFTPSDASWAGIALVIGAWAGAERKGNAATGRRGQDRRHGRSPE
jgi:hypothetical protein